jgi:hypothetical protein
MSGDQAMRVIALEEHVTVPHLVRQTDPGAVRRRGFRPRRVESGAVDPMAQAPELASGG